MITHRDVESVEYIKPLSRPYYEGRPLDLWWPFWAWRIVAPEDSNETDIFQELMLRLINAGCHDVKALAGYSCLHPGFVQHLVSILTQKEMLHGWTLTETGTIALETGFNKGRLIKSYYIFQDAYSGKLIPRVFDTLNFIDGVRFNEGRAEYTLSRESGKSIRPVMLRVSDHSPVQPVVEDVYEAIRHHRLDRNKLKQAGFDGGRVDLKADQVEMLEDAPIAIYMHLNMFVDQNGERPWYLSDPAGLMPSLHCLNEVAESRLEADKFFADRVEQLLGIAAENKDISYSDKLKILDEKAKATLIKNYSWVSNIPFVEKYVLLMIRDKEDFLSSEKPPSWMLDRLVGSLQNVCESTVKLLSPPSQDRNEWKKVSFKDELRNRPQIRAIYECCSAVDSDLAHNFSKIRSGQIKTAMQTGGQSLRQLLAALVLTSADIVAEIDGSIPGWLNNAIDLADSRNKAQHANDHELDISAMRSHLDFVEQLLKVIEGKVVNG